MFILDMEDVQSLVRDLVECCRTLDAADDNRRYLPPALYRNIAEHAIVRLGHLLSFDNELVLSIIKHLSQRSTAANELFETFWVSQLIVEVPGQLTALNEVLNKIGFKKVK